MPAGAAMLPDDWRSGSFVGRVLTADGPTPVLLHAAEIRDLSRIAPTVSQLLDLPDLIERAAQAPLLGTPEELFAPPLLAPIDLQCIKAAGVTFAVSAIERVIEERSRGQAELARALRTEIEASIGCDLRGLVPGSATAVALKESLLRQGLWSQYLEVAIGPDAEIFTKAPVLSAMGWGAPIGIRSDSHWNNPEPEMVLAVNSRGQIVGATLGNDVNLRDFEGRSALLLGKSKDNNGSCALGPLIRLIDATFTLEDIRTATVELTISGADGYVLHGRSTMQEISRSPEQLVAQTLSEHDYPDGFVLFLGTLFAPVQDRDQPGRGFTHKTGDVVSIASSRLGTLVNRVGHCRDLPPWSFGVGALMRNLAQRGLLE